MHYSFQLKFVNACELVAVCVHVCLCMSELFVIYLCVHIVWVGAIIFFLRVRQFLRYSYIFFMGRVNFFFPASFVAFRGQVSLFSMAMVVVLIYTFISSGVEGRGFWGKEEFSSFYLHCSILLF